MRRVCNFRWAVVGVTLLCAPALAHKPVAVGTLESGPDEPIALFDIGVSQVLYFEPSETYPRVWASFSAGAGAVLKVQPGVPVIEGLEEVRPAFAVLGPGLPEIALPFDVPEGLGGAAFNTADTVPTVFDEPFTGTRSWQFPVREITLPEAGEYLLVAYVPGGGPDKFWVAVGEREEFTLADILTLPSITLQVRAFHEVFPIGGIGLVVPLLLLLGGLLALLSKFSAA